MKKILNWKIGCSVAAFVASIVSAWAAICAAETVDGIASLCYTIALLALIIIEIVMTKKVVCCSKENFINAEIDSRKVNSWFRKSRFLAFLLLLISIIGLILYFADIDVALGDVIRVLFAFVLFVKAIVDTLNFNK